MKIVMNERQYEELRDLVEIFEEAYFEEEGFDSEKVQCFDLLKEIVDSGSDTKNIPQKTKEKMQKQLIKAFEFFESIGGNVRIVVVYKDEFLSYFSAD